MVWSMKQVNSLSELLAALKILIFPTEGAFTRVVSDYAELSPTVVRLVC